jgi:WhiB family redox-sensing transcriptional regulator
VIGRDEIPEWVSQGLCGQVDPEIFYVDKGGSVAPAKRVCLACDVRAQCLEWALEMDDDFGVWGGLSRDERWALRRERRSASPDQAVAA